MSILKTYFMKNYLFQEKTSEELVKEMNKAIEKCDDMSEEKIAEFDAKFGYFQDDEDNYEE